MVAGGTLALLALAGCGGQKAQDADEPKADFPVEITQASFPVKQRLAQASNLRIAVRNSGTRTIPNVAVTVKSAEPDQTHDSAAFAEASTQPGLADPSRPVWVMDYGPKGGVTAYVNTWALGALRPGQTRTFVWHVTAVKAGVHSVKYTVAAGLNGKARAQLAGGGDPSGTFRVSISRKPPDARVAPDGRVVVTPRD